MVDDPLTLRQAAKEFHVSLPRLRKAAEEGRLAATRPGNEYLVRPSEVSRFIRERGRRATTVPVVARREGSSMARIISVAIPKGGSGKTTTVINLGAALAELGQRVLLVDLDFQGSLTTALGLDPDHLAETSYTALKRFTQTYDTSTPLPICPTAIGVDLLPTNIDLTLAETELLQVFQRDHILQRLLAGVADQYDTILIDTHPSLDVLVDNALVAGPEVIIPLQAEFLSTRSLPLLLSKIQLMQRAGLKVQVLGVLLTMAAPRTVIGRDTINFIRTTYGPHVRVFNTIIARSTRFPETPALATSILHHDPHGEGACAYRALAQEITNASA